MKKILFIIFSILIVDQILKIYVKTHFELGNGFPIFPFFWIFFIENPGMAYGFHIAPGYFGKIILSIFRFILVLYMSIFLYQHIKKKTSNYFIIPISLIFSGSLGNLIDSILYGLLFNIGTIYNKETHKWISYTGISKMNFFLKGYASFMEGCVVDIFYCPLIDSYIPNYIPFFGGYHFQFFKPVFNFSDFIIFIGLISLFFFKKKNKYIKIF